MVTTSELQYCDSISRYESKLSCAESTCAAQALFTDAEIILLETDPEAHCYLPSETAVPKITNNSPKSSRPTVIS